MPLLLADACQMQEDNMRDQGFDFLKLLKLGGMPRLRGHEVGQLRRSKHAHVGGPPRACHPGEIGTDYFGRSRTTGSIVLVLRSTAKMTVRCSTPSAVLATMGIT